MFRPRAATLRLRAAGWVSGFWLWRGGEGAESIAREFAWAPLQDGMKPDDVTDELTHGDDEGLADELNDLTFGGDSGATLSWVEPRITRAS